MANQSNPIQKSAAQPPAPQGAVTNAVTRLPAKPLAEFDLGRARARNRKIMEASKWAVETVFERGIHFGKYPGWNADELLQPGGDVILNLCSLTARDRVLEQKLDFGPQRPFAHYVVQVDIVYAAGTPYEEVVATASALCHSFESGRMKRTGYDPQYALNTFNTIYAMAAKRAKLKAICQVGFLNEMGFTVDIGDTHQAATHRPDGRPNGQRQMQGGGQQRSPASAQNQTQPARKKLIVDRLVANTDRGGDNRKPAAYLTGFDGPQEVELGIWSRQPIADALGMARDAIEVNAPLPRPLEVEMYRNQRGFWQLDTKAPMRVVPPSEDGQKHEPVQPWAEQPSQQQMPGTPARHHDMDFLD